MRILLAEDEVTIFVTLRDALEEAGHEVLGATDTRAAIELLENEQPDVVVTDIRMPGEGGLAVLARAVELDEARPVILMTGYATVDQAVEAMRLGAVDYVQKPFRNEIIVQRIATLTRVRALESENRNLRAQLRERGSFEHIVGESKAMQKVFERVSVVAPTDATVLIQGESGTGKERIALALHQESARSEGPFIAISCAALPEGLLEAELFGHEKGAFTDARRSRRGRFELAHGGSLFLDDIDDMPLTVQVKLLRVLQERNLERLGSEETIDVDIRVIVATKVPLRDLVRKQRFREDLFYRVNVVPVLLPPLRERASDVPLLVKHFIERFSPEAPHTVSDPTLDMLQRYPWPGNVRELENAIQRGIALAGKRSSLAAEDLLPQDTRWRGANEVVEDVEPLKSVLRGMEIAHIRRVLQLTGGHRSQAADLLGISRKVLWEKLRELDIQVPGAEK
ncbi:MAG: DNA-binding NtrC family response regulator [Chlamydiales bacterium]|jgi:DNA-binding NtrC family response regulator